MDKKIFIFAGEPSGDLHGSHLLKALKNSIPNCQFEAVAGPLMRNVGVDQLLPMESFAVMGFTDVFLSLPGLIKKFYKVRNYILKSQPDAVILIDYPGFNLRLASILRKKGYTGKIVQYISPTVWAHGSNRIQQMSDTLNLLLTIYPFEKKYFENSPLKVEYIGHPLCQAIQNHHYIEFKNDQPLIAIFPGSRSGEIKRNFIKILESAASFTDVTFAISIANEKVKPLIEEILKTSSLKNYILVPKEQTYELMKNCRTAIAKSGTVTLELALHEKPTVVVYELSRLNRFIAKRILKVNLPFYCIVNILGEGQVFPELIEQGFTSSNLTKHLLSIHVDGIARDTCIAECKRIKATLNELNPTEKAAYSILEVLSC